jgi:2-oxoglutarate ferredoxin oxidoreductase subunit alpha
VDRIDLLVALDKGTRQHLARRLSEQTLVLAEAQVVGMEFDGSPCRFVDLPLTSIAVQIGNKLFSNTVAVGAIAGLAGIDLDYVHRAIRMHFGAKDPQIVEGNLKAATAGYEFAQGMAGSDKAPPMKADDRVKGHIVLSGGEAVGLGALAGGCNFISSYPMSPSTPVLTFLARHGRDLGVIAEQAEDEIAAMNMAIGAWYAGARAMVTTSGGGFALMTEGLSLAGMFESPMVIHLAQRPGPATGLPTRTEQADLELALYAGHGEFPRIILAPGNLAQAFSCTEQAFTLADRFQIPVFVLTDQYLIDTYYNVEPFEIPKASPVRHVIKSNADYCRYAMTDDGISPRAIPGYGDGLVVLDSDEHDEQGHITEDLDLRVRMVQKRLHKKLPAIQAAALAPSLIGPKSYKDLIVCWGSSLEGVKEALASLNRKDMAILHFHQVYPLHTDVAAYLKKARRLILLEGNVTGQLGKVIQLATGIAIERKILRYNGLPFSVEDVAAQLKEHLA